MKRFLGACAVVLFGVTLAASAFAATPVLWGRQQLKWRTQVASVNALGFVDSLTASINQLGITAATVDTTVAFSTADFAWANGVDGITAHGAFRVAFTCPAANNTDTLFVAVESSPDGTVWATNSTFVGMVGTSGDEYISGVVTAGNATQGTTGAATTWMQPYLRLRVRADGNTNGNFLGAKCYIIYPKNPAH